MKMPVKEKVKVKVKEQALISWERIKGAGRSLTVWVNGAILAVLPLYEMFKDEVEKFKPFLNDFDYQKVVTTIVVVNILLRFKTTKDLAEK